MIAFLKKESQSVIILGLTVITLAVYWPVQDFPFIYYDDDEYVYDNPHVQQGLSINNFLWAFQSRSAANWHPLTWLSLMLDTDLYGKNPEGYHLTSLLLHIFNVLLLFLILSKLTKTKWRCAFVSCLFALHPLHVESVAWISERKDLLCALFMLLSIWAYSDYVGTRKLPAYIRALIYFAFGLMAKPMLVTLPIVLLLLDFWPLSRFVSGTNTITVKEGASGYRHGTIALLLEKVPFLLLSISSCFITLYVQKASGAVADFPLDRRVANAVISYLLYLRNTVFPCHLAFFYPFPSSINLVFLAVSVLIMGGISVAAIRSRRRVPWFFTGWYWYMGTLLPVIGVIQVGAQAMADRYTYIPLIGLFVIFSWGITCVFAFRLFQRIMITVIALCLCGVLSVMARRQVNYWQSSASLFRHALVATDHNHVAHNNLGKVLYLQNMPDSARHHFSEAIKILPTYSIALYNFAYVLKQQGKFNEAIPLFQQAIACDSNYFHAYQRLAETYERLGKDSLTIVYSRRALRLDRDSFSSWLLLAKTLYNNNSLDTALQYVDNALRCCPSCWEAHYYLGLIYLKKRLLDSCFYHLSYSLRLNPFSWSLCNSMGQELFRYGQGSYAVRMYSRAINLAPTMEKIYLNRAIVFAVENKLDSAVADCQHALRLKPNFTAAHFCLGRVFEQMGAQDSAKFHMREAGKTD
ncbi:MAG TPA: tetratricopeptide repeat protein [Chitinivibrionales bacterium]|nr:tetratricopeptide repeat protein [Chitinivibrionales bacterium]